VAYIGQKRQNGRSRDFTVHSPMYGELRKGLRAVSRPTYPPSYEPFSL
jgi:hypothetical protein